MNNLKIYEKNLKKKVGAIALSIVLGVTTLGLTGCSKDAKEETKDNVVYTVEDVIDDYNVLDYHTSYAKIKKDAVCENYVDLNQLPDCSATSIMTGDMVGMSEEELANTNYKLDYVYPVRELKLSSGGVIENIGTGYTSMTTATFRHDRAIIIPDCYKWAENYFGSGFDSYLSTINYTLQELKGINGNYYVNYDFNIEFNEDINVPGGITFDASNEFYQKYGTQKSIKEGDSLNYKALYIMRYDQDNNKIFDLLADEQTGMGSDSENVQLKVKHNYGNVYKNIESLDRNNESKEFSSMDEFEDFIFDKRKVKTRN